MLSLPPVLAHPLTEPSELGLAPAFVALLAGAVVVIAGRVLALPSGTTHAETPAEVAAGSPTGDRSSPWIITGRVIGVGLLVLAVTAGRLGVESQFDNIAPALVIGFGWPLLLALSAAVGSVWAWLQPFDTLARGLQRLGGVADVQAPGPTWLPWVAVAGALGWGWWLAIYLPGLDPRPLSLALGLYTIVMLAGALRLGRRRWLSQAEIFGVTFQGISRARRVAPTWLSAPHVMAFAVLLAGLSFAEIRFSSWFLLESERVGLDPFSAPPAVIGFALVLALVVGAVLVAERWAVRIGGLLGVHRMLPWMVVAAGLSAALERNRLWSSAQLVVIRASNPFGGDVNLFGTAEWRLLDWPFDDLGRVLTQVAVLVIPVAVGVVLAVRADPGRRTRPGVVLSVGWLVVAVASVTTL